LTIGSMKPAARRRPVFPQRIREAQETIEVIRKVHPANHPEVTQVAEFLELHAAHEREQGRTEKRLEREDRVRGCRRAWPDNTSAPSKRRLGLGEPNA
jgi:hypothetical protein